MLVLPIPSPHRCFIDRRVECTQCGGEITTSRSIARDSFGEPLAADRACRGVAQLFDGLAIEAQPYGVCRGVAPGASAVDRRLFVGRPQTEASIVVTERLA